MLKRTLSGIMLTLLVMSMLPLVFPSNPTSKETAINWLIGEKDLTGARKFSFAETSESIASSAESIINPQPGQYANYSHNCYYENGTVIWSGWWSMSYTDFLAINLIDTTTTIVRPMEPNGTFWFAINLTDRWIPYGNLWWVNSWYVCWIETNITVGSVIKIWITDGTVTGSTISKVELNGQETSIDCWKVQFSEPMNPSMNYTVLFDKRSGILIEMASSYEPYMNLTLMSTNIPIEPSPFITATMDIHPRTLNLKSKGKWITAYIELPEGYNVSDINATTILLNDTTPIEPHPIAIGDYDNDSIPDLMVKFNRAQVIEYIKANVNMTKLFEERFMTITLTITGKLNDGTVFQGSDTIRITIHTGRGAGRHTLLK